MCVDRLIELIHPTLYVVVFTNTHFIDEEDARDSDGYAGSGLELFN